MCKGEPDYWTYITNGQYRAFSPIKPPDNAYNEGTLEPLYAAPVTTQKDDGVVEVVIDHWPEQDAEVEALRAEVERVTCELMDATTRADKLAEALGQKEGA